MRKKIRELESKIESAKVTAARREQLLTDPNKFTDKCVWFRVYWQGNPRYDVLGRQESHGEGIERPILQYSKYGCVCDLSKKQAHSVLGTVNAGLGCK